MDKPKDPPDTPAPVGDGGYRSRSGAAGFFVALKSLIWPEEGAARGPEEAPPPVPGLQMLPGMPRRATTQHAVPSPPVDASTAESHPFRRPAGSAGRWKKQLADAKQAWPLLGIDELVATDGHVQKLAGLVQERYGLAHDVAEQQVLRFLGMPDQSGSP